MPRTLPRRTYPTGGTGPGPGNAPAKTFACAMPWSAALLPAAVSPMSALSRMPRASPADRSIPPCSIRRLRIDYLSLLGLLCRLPQLPLLFRPPAWDPLSAPLHLCRPCLTQHILLSSLLYPAAPHRRPCRPLLHLTQTLLSLSPGAGSSLTCSPVHHLRSLQQLPPWGWIAANRSTSCPDLMWMFCMMISFMPLRACALLAWWVRRLLVRPAALFLALASAREVPSRSALLLTRRVFLTLTLVKRMSSPSLHCSMSEPVPSCSLLLPGGASLSSKIPHLASLGSPLLCPRFCSYSGPGRGLRPRHECRQVLVTGL